MRIERLSISNHAVVPDLDVAVSDHLVFIGPNETGKSTCLRLLDAVFNGNMANLYALLGPEAFADVAEPVVCKLVLVDPDEVQQAAFADEIAVRSDGSYALTVQVTSSLDVVANDVEVSREAVKSGYSTSISARSLTHAGYVFLPATRSPDRELSRGQTSALRSLLRTVDLGPERANLEEQLQDLHDALDGATSLVELKEALASQLSRLSPRRIEQNDISLRLAASSGDDLLADVEVRLGTGTEQRSLAHQSDGFRAMATVAIQMMANDGTSMIAVDEPETHLHPTAQRRIGRLLRDAPQQTVIATHSASVLAQFEPGHIVALTGRNQSRALTSDPFAKKRKAHPAWWASDRLEALTSRALVLVEGLADRIVVSATARALGIDLDRLGITVVEVDGSGNFSMAWRIYGAAGFDVPLSVIVDEKELPDVAGYLGVPEDELTALGVRVCRPDLEWQYVRDIGPERVRQCLVESGDFRPSSLPELDGGGDPAALMTQLCGSNKTRAAMALSVALTHDDAASLTPIVEALQFVGAFGA